MDKIINIAVVAHVDAGKSTLVDALLKQNGAFQAHEEVGELIMDSDSIEKERGITIYSKNCSIKYKDYKINIVDTPGHADFSSEVERVIKTVDTVVLIVDSSEGPMPQTRFVLKKALEQNLRPILFINKIDKKDARPTEVVDMTFNLFMELNATDEQLDFPIVYGIAKEGKCGLTPDKMEDTVTPLLETILNQVNAYPGNESDPLQLQISNLDYDNFLGRLGVGRISKGCIKNGETVSLARNDGKIESFRISKLYVTEGIKRVEKDIAYFGDIVTIAGCADISIGDTICAKDHVEPLPPIHIERPTLSMNFLVNNGPFAGKSGKYLTSRHIKERLEREYHLNLVATAPSVVYHVYLTDHTMITLDNPSKLPDIQRVERIEEPYVLATIMTPQDYIGPLMELCQQKRGIYVDLKYIDDNRMNLIYKLPLAEIVYNFFDRLKSCSRGFASFDYVLDAYMPSKLVKMDILLNNHIVDALSCIVHRDFAYNRGRIICQKLRKIIPRQQFEVPIQAAINGKVIARETIAALRKDVLAKCYGGDITRKKKLLEKQKEGKKRMKKIGNVDIPQEAFMTILSVDDE